MATSATSSQGGGALTCYHVGRGIIYDASGLPVPLAAGNNVFDDIYVDRIHDKAGTGMPDFPQGLDVTGTGLVVRTGGITVTGNSTITGTLGVSGATTSGGALTVSAGGAAITGNSTVTGTLGVSGATTSGGALTVSAGGAAITGNSTVTGTLGVSGATTSGGALTVSAGGAAITGNSTVTGNLNITGNTTLGDAVADTITVTAGIINRTGCFGTFGAPVSVNTAGGTTATTATTTAFRGSIVVNVTVADFTNTSNFTVNIPNVSALGTHVVKVWALSRSGAFSATGFQIAATLGQNGVGYSVLIHNGSGGDIPVGGGFSFVWEAELWT